MVGRKYYTGGKQHGVQDAPFIAALDDDLWQSGTPDDWKSCWYVGMPKPSYFMDLSNLHNINHIPGNNALTVKSRLHETLRAARERQTAADRAARYDFFPRVFDMPGDYHAFQDHAARHPEARWILKPKNSSRGRGIELVTDPADVPSGPRWMVQDYLSDPDLINGRKYVLRLYVLITSISPLQVYLYREGFAKLASEPFALDDLENPFAHLTNPDINAHNSDRDVPVVFHTLAQYRDILRDRGRDPGPLFARIRDLVALTTIAARESFRARLEKGGVNGQACYELIGLDCMIDADLKPWLIECNLSPSLDTCTMEDAGDNAEAAIKMQVVADLVAMRGHNASGTDARPDPDAYTDRAAFIADTLAFENRNRGGYDRLIPAAGTIGDYLPFFAAPLHDDLLAARTVDPGTVPPDLIGCDLAPFFVTQEGRIAIFSRRTGGFITLSVQESWVWLNLATGTSAPRISADMLATFQDADAPLDAATAHTVRGFAWDCLARWVERGYCRLSDRGRAADDISPDPETPKGRVETSFALDILGTALSLTVPEAWLAEAVSETYAPFLVDGPPDADVPSLSIVRGRGGYHIVRRGSLGPLNLRADILSALHRTLLAQLCSAEFPLALLARVNPSGDGGTARIALATSGSRAGPGVEGVLANFATGRFLALGPSGETLFEAVEFGQPCATHTPATPDAILDWMVEHAVTSQTASPNAPGDRLSDAHWRDIIAYIQPQAS